MNDSDSAFIRDILYTAACYEVEAGELKAQKAKEELRPCMLMKPKLVRSTTDRRWLAFFGDVNAYGDSPEGAYREFDKKWSGRYD